MKADFVEQYHIIAELLESIKESVRRCHALDDKWVENLAGKKHVRYEISRPTQFDVNFFDQLKPAILHQISAVSLLNRVSRWGDGVGKNPFAIPAQALVEETLRPAHIERPVL